MPEFDMEVHKLTDGGKVINEIDTDLEIKDHQKKVATHLTHNAVIRRTLVFKLKKAALTYEEIAQKVIEIYKEKDNLHVEQLPETWGREFARKDVTQYVQKYKEQLLETAQETVIIECNRIDEMINALWDRVRDVNGPAELRAMDRILKLQKRKAKFLGLDQPEKVQVQDKTEEGFEFGWADPDAAPSSESGNKDEE